MTAPLNVLGLVGLVSSTLISSGSAPAARAGFAARVAGRPSPSVSDADWTVTGGEAHAELGGSVASAGDVNGDGFSDVVIGAIGFNAGQTIGAAFLYQGSASGLPDTPDWIALGFDQYTGFGWRVACAGDVNGDGFDDVLVAAPSYENGHESEGRVFIYFGSALGLSLTADWGAESDHEDAHFGMSASSAGDVNADGFDDVLIGAPHLDAGFDGEGRVYLYLGGPNGPSATPDWVSEGNSLFAGFGEEVSGAGDVNGDGFDDVLVSARKYPARVHLYRGSPSGLPASPQWTVLGVGYRPAGAGDVNGDGWDDILIGAHDSDNGETDEGRAYVFFGSAAGPSTTPGWTIESNRPNANLGAAVSGSGDIDADGFDEILVGAPGYSYGQDDEGRVYVFHGSSSGPSIHPYWRDESDQTNAFYGSSVAAVGDVNGDGFGDVIVGAKGFDQQYLNEGRAYLYLGAPFLDCNGNGTDDVLDIQNGVSDDCNSNGTPDECEPDCNLNGVADDCDLALATSPDCNANEIPDECDIAAGRSVDCNANGVPDECDLDSGTSMDCNANWIPDDCDVSSGASDDADGNGVPDECGTIGTHYCIAFSNSTGAAAHISAWGSASASTGDLLLRSEPVPNQPGIFFHGAASAQILFCFGYRCAAGGIVRSAVVGGFANVASVTYDNSDPKHSVGAFVGSTRYFQHWYRDPMAGGCIFNLSNAVAITILP